MLMPDLRVGFLAAEGPIYDTLVNLKCLNDLATSNLTQRALDAYLSVGSYQAHLRKTVSIYRKRRDAMIAALKKYLGSRVRCSVTQGGFLSGSDLNIPSPCKSWFSVRCRPVSVLHPESDFLSTSRIWKTT